MSQQRSAMTSNATSTTPTQTLTPKSSPPSKDPQLHQSQPRVTFAAQVSEISPGHLPDTLSPKHRARSTPSIAVPPRTPTSPSPAAPNASSPVGIPNKGGVTPAGDGKSQAWEAEKSATGPRRSAMAKSSHCSPPAKPSNLSKSSGASMSASSTHNAVPVRSQHSASFTARPLPSFHPNFNKAVKRERFLGGCKKNFRGNEELLCELCDMKLYGTADLIYHYEMHQDAPIWWEIPKSLELMLTENGVLRERVPLDSMQNNLFTQKSVLNVNIEAPENTKLYYHQVGDREAWNKLMDFYVEKLGKDKINPNGTKYFPLKKMGYINFYSREYMLKALEFSPGSPCEAFKFNEEAPKYCAFAVGFDEWKVDQVKPAAAKALGATQLILKHNEENKCVGWGIVGYQSEKELTDAINTRKFTFKVNNSTLTILVKPYRAKQVKKEDLESEPVPDETPVDSLETSNSKERELKQYRRFSHTVPTDNKKSPSPTASLANSAPPIKAKTAHSVPPQTAQAQAPAPPAIVQEPQEVQSQIPIQVPPQTTAEPQALPMQPTKIELPCEVVANCPPPVPLPCPLPSPPMVDNCIPPPFVPLECYPGMMFQRNYRIWLESQHLVPPGPPSGAYSNELSSFGSIDPYYPPYAFAPWPLSF